MIEISIWEIVALCFACFGLGINVGHLIWLIIK
jgi:hypothetical protein